MPNSEIAILLTLIDQAFDHNWHGTNLKGSRIDANAAAWRPL
jgi:hypothetical protein